MRRGSGAWRGREDVDCARRRQPAAPPSRRAPSPAAGDNRAASAEIEKHRQARPGHPCGQDVSPWAVSRACRATPPPLARACRTEPNSDLISGRHEPQLVPARVANPISEAEQAPPAMAASMRLRPTWKQAHTTGPSSAPPTGRPASSAGAGPCVNDRQREAASSAIRWTAAPGRPRHTARPRAGRRAARRTRNCSARASS